MSPVRPHVTAFASVSWDGRVVFSEKSGEMGAAAGAFEGELLASSDAVVVDVSTGSPARVDSAFVLFPSKALEEPRGKQRGDGFGGGSFLRSARGCGLAGAREKAARLGLVKRLKQQGSEGGAVVYTTQPESEDLPQASDGAANLRRFGGGEWDALEMMRSLSLEFGVHRLALCGGGTLLGALLRAGCLDELWLTFCPQILGNKGGETLSGPAGSFLPASVKASLVWMKQLDGECFTKWVLNISPVRKRVLRKS